MGPTLELLASDGVCTIRPTVGLLPWLGCRVSQDALGSEVPLISPFETEACTHTSFTSLKLQLKPTADPAVGGTGSLVKVSICQRIELGARESVISLRRS